MSRLKSTSLPKPQGKVCGVWGGSVNDGVVALAWSPDGSAIAVAGATSSIVVFRAEDGGQVCSAPEHRWGNLTVAWHPQSRGDLLATAGQDGIVRLVNGRTGFPCHELTAGENWVGCLAWRPDGTMLATGAGRTLRFWDAEGRPLLDCERHPSTITDLKWRPGSELLASAAYGGVCFWAGDAPRAKQAFEFQGSMLVLAWSPSGKYLVSGNQDSTVVFWDYDSLEEPAEMTGFPAKLQSLSWDSSSRFLITASGCIACLWDFQGKKGPRGSRPLVLDYHQKPIKSVAFQRQGALFATAGEDGALVIWRRDRKDAVVTGAFDFAGPVSAIAWSPNDRSIVCGCENGAVALLAVD